ncbi:hypothetical protein KRP22_009496 [Phytophthora ramorum]|nr:NADH dehydrogenase [ubiquinone] 1 alpha subcomplex subunit 2 [Phytophthora ramorum]
MSWRAQISRSIQELRFVACDTSQSSAGLRTFFRKNYDELKMLNPLTPFVYREAEEMEPFVASWTTGLTLPKSPESDIILAAPIIEAIKGEDAYEPINLTWDGKTVRRNPDFDIPVEEALKP